MTNSLLADRMECCIFIPNQTVYLSFIRPIKILYPGVLELLDHPIYIDSLDIRRDTFYP